MTGCAFIPVFAVLKAPGLTRQRQALRSVPVPGAVVAAVMLVLLYVPMRCQPCRSLLLLPCRCSGDLTQ